MLHIILKYFYLLFVFLGGFFIFSSIVGFIRYKDFYMKLHAAAMFHIYGINFILFTIGINSYKPVIFFEMLLVIITNTLCTFCIIHCFIRNAVINGLEYKAKTREEVIKEKTEELKKKILKQEIKINKKEEERKRKEEEKERKEMEKKNKYNNKKIDKKEEKIINKNNNEQNIKIENNKKIEKNETKQNIEKTVDIKKEINNKQKANHDDDTEKKQIEKENEELKKKIKEQKKILKKKIETARKNAFITRKPEEIEKTEKIIKDILTKYNLTEEMLDNDD